MSGIYSRYSNLVLAFHGCDRSLADDVINGRQSLKMSRNDYDWLGHGVYFWENSPERALDWARELSRRPRSSVRTPAVIGAVIDLGYCFDLIEMGNLRRLRQAYDYLVMSSVADGFPLPANTNAGGGNDLLLRKLDCAVVEAAHRINLVAEDRDFDTVRAAFWEGRPLYENAGFAEKNHIQICVCNTDCIKGYFLPRQ